MMRAAKKDANHNEIDESFKSLGYRTQDLSQLKNACDLLAIKGKKTFLVEIKDGSKPPSARKLSQGEKAFAEKWDGIWVKIESVNDVIILDKAVA